LLLILIVKLKAAGEVVSLSSATVKAVPLVDLVNSGVRSTTPAVDGSRIVPFLTPSLSP